MPQIDVYTAQTPAKVPDQPLRFLESGENPAAKIQQQSQALGQQMADIGGRIKSQTADLQFLDRKYQSENDTAAIRQELERDPEVMANPQLYEARFLERKHASEDAINQSFTDDEAKAHYAFYRGHKEQADFVEVRAHGLKMQDAKNVGDYVITRDRLATKAATAPGEGALLEAIADHQMLVTNMVATGGAGMNAKWGENEMIRFRQDVAKKNMIFIGGQNPTEFRMRLNRGDWPDSLVPVDDKQQVLEHVNSQERIADNARIEQNKQVQEAYYWIRYRVAAQGLLPETDIQKGLAEGDPMLPDPVKWQTLKRINDKAAGRGSSGLGGIAAIRFAHNAIDNPTIEDHQEAKRALALFLEDSNPDQKTMDAANRAVEHFNSEIGKLKAEDRADARAIESKKGSIRAEKADVRSDKHEAQRDLDRKIAAAETLYIERNDRVAVGRGLAKAFQENKVKQQKAAIKRIYNMHPELTPEQVVERVLGKNVGTVTPDPDEQDKDGIDYLNRTKPGQ